jgi:hypothetical protein|tara:strand:+ start:309 stop:431 length:123 start_codon:yes stop_codon:yes gene_type:complete
MGRMEHVLRLRAAANRDFWRSVVIGLTRRFGKFAVDIGCG